MLTKFKMKMGLEEIQNLNFIFESPWCLRTDMECFNKKLLKKWYDIAHNYYKLKIIISLNLLSVSLINVNCNKTLKYTIFNRYFEWGESFLCENTVFPPIKKQDSVFFHPIPLHSHHILKGQFPFQMCLYSSGFDCFKIIKLLLISFQHYYYLLDLFCIIAHTW